MNKDLSTEEKILQAARKIFLDKGLDGARMQDIADEAGINKAMLHYYFRNKEKLFDTIFSQVASEFLPRLFTILASDKTVFEKIELFCNAYIQQEIQTPYVPMFIITEMNRNPQNLIKKIRSTGQPPFSIIVSQIQREVKQKIIKPVEPVQLLLNIISLCVFPFLARPMVQIVTGMNMKQFNEMMNIRSKAIAAMIINSIKA